MHSISSLEADHVHFDSLLVHKIAYSGVHQELHLAFNYREKQQKNNPHGHSNTVAPAVNSIIGPRNTIAQFVKVPGFSSTGPSSITNLPCPPALILML